jgi:DNA-binding response OmpR family regulator
MTSMLRSDSFLTGHGVMVVDPNETSRKIIVPLIEDLKPGRLVVTKMLSEARSTMSGRVDPYDIVLVSVVNPPSSGFHFLQEIRTGAIPRCPRDT